MLVGSEMFTALWLAPAACLAVEDITAARRANHSSLPINQGPAPFPPAPVALLRSALQGHFYPACNSYNNQKQFSHYS